MERLSNAFSNMQLNTPTPQQNANGVNGQQQQQQQQLAGLQPQYNIVRPPVSIHQQNFLQPAQSNRLPNGLLNFWEGQQPPSTAQITAAAMQWANQADPANRNAGGHLSMYSNPNETR
jgi:hypothetical protein